VKGLDAALKAAGAVLLRQHKHRIYRLPNGHNYVCGSTPSDNRAERNAIKVLNRVASLPPTKGTLECHV
jgi:hypothetical protein